MISREAILLVLFFCFSLIGGTGYLWIEDELTFTNWWMIWIALGYPVLFAVIRLQSKEFYAQLFSSSLLILSIGEVIDEFGYLIAPEIFNPTFASWNEYFFIALVIFYIVLKCKRKQKQG